jgi:hypothetical protein
LIKSTLYKMVYLLQYQNIADHQLHHVKSFGAKAWGWSGLRVLDIRNFSLSPCGYYWLQGIQIWWRDVCTAFHADRLLAWLRAPEHKHVFPYKAAELQRT